MDINNSKRILYVGRFGIPNTAPGIRVYNVAKIFRELGYSVDFICERFVFDDSNVHQLFDNFNFYFLNKIKGSKIKSFLYFAQNLTAYLTFKKIKSYCKEKKPDIIILYNDIFSLSYRMINYCKKNKIKLIADVTEWYEYDKKLRFINKINVFLVDKRIRYIDKKIKNIIAISPYFYEYYINKNCNTFFLPPVFDMNKEIIIKKFDYYDYKVINLVYAGSPENKDILKPCLMAIKAFNKDEIKIRIDLIGLDAEYVIGLIGNIPFHNYGIIAHGKLPHDKTIEVVKRADFGLLLRDNKRYAKFGFSTKFSECMSLGVPMICNSVGGAEIVLENMVDGFVLNNCNEEILFNVLTEIYDLGEQKIIIMKQNAVKKAFEIFAYKNYKDKMKEFLEGLKHIEG